MDDTKMNRLREELENARSKRDHWEAKVKDLERRYKEAENTCIHELVHAANLTPEKLAELIRSMQTSLPQTINENNENGNGSEEIYEKEDFEE